MPDIKIIQAEYVVCPRTKKGEWMEKCMKCIYYKYRQVNETVRCKYGEK